MKKRRQSGFSLIELLLVVAIILIIAAIAIPNLMASRIAANESAAAQATRVVTTSEVVYFTQYNIGYAPALVDLGDAGGCGIAAVTSTNSCLIDALLAGGAKGGYNFTYAATNADAATHFQGFTLNADPQNAGRSGRKHFFADQTAVIRMNVTAIASISDPAM